MYLSWLCHVINVANLWMILNCLKASKKVKGEKKTFDSTPIAYETDPAILEKERKQKVAETRARMRKKREKMCRNDLLKTMLAEQQKNSKETPTLHEQSTQSSATDDVQTAVNEAIGHSEELEPSAEFDEGQKIAHMKLTSETENLGDVCLVDNSPDTALKKELVKKQARDAAKEKEMAEAMLRKFNSPPEESYPSPDHSLKNVSSLPYESQLSMIQKKRKQMEQNQKPLKESVDSGSGSEKTHGPDVLEKSSILYVREAVKH